jgi:hypothetical protein
VFKCPSAAWRLGRALCEPRVNWSYSRRERSPLGRTSAAPCAQPRPSRAGPRRRSEARWSACGGGRGGSVRAGVPTTQGCGMQRSEAGGRAEREVRATQARMVRGCAIWAKARLRPYDRALGWWEDAGEPTQRYSCRAGWGREGHALSTWRAPVQLCARWGRVWMWRDVEGWVRHPPRWWCLRIPSLFFFLGNFSDLPVNFDRILTESVNKLKNN